MESLKWSKGNRIETRTIIVGGGIAGLSAAHTLGNADFKLFELSSDLGGTSGAISSHGVTMSQGAHYDLAYPDYYGKEVIQLLQKLDIIEYESWSGLWNFKDQQHLIPDSRKEICWDQGTFRNEVIADEQLRKQFIELTSAYDGRLPLPTRLIEEELRSLDQINFEVFLRQNLPVDDAFIAQMDYHMLDDYGGTARQVSAIAGLVYFACRPYHNKPVPLFSPPGGNHYFVSRLVDTLHPSKLHVNHLVREIRKIDSGFEVDVADISNKTIHIAHCNKVIYAGQKHALKYIYPEEYALFDVDYAPWMVINFLCDQLEGEYGFWQNEYLGDNPSFLGFVDSSVQHRSDLMGKRVFTAYYCLKPSDRNYLAEIEQHAESIATITWTYIQNVVGKRVKPQQAWIKVMGHAMPIPKPGYLFNEPKNTDLIYAGVDHHRLPLLFEAMDSGIMAAKLLS
jgi:hypothetical protein